MDETEWERQTAGAIRNCKRPAAVIAPREEGSVAGMRGKARGWPLWEAGRSIPRGIV
jgi:hypothetical protein